MKEETMLKRFVHAVLLLVLTAGSLFPQDTSNKRPVPGDAVFAFVDVNVVPMDSERLIRSQTVIVREGRIATMGPAKSVRLPKGAVRIDGRGRYLMPGLADMHVHLEYFDRDTQLLLFLANGVTTVRNMDGRPNILSWQKRIADGTLIGPTIFTAGAILEGKPPLRDDNRVVETPAQAEAAVEEQKRAGYDFVKVYHTLSRETYEAIVAAARKHGLTVAGHVPRSVGLRGALAARQKSIEHLDGYVDEIEADDSPLRNQRSWLKRFFAVKVDEDKIRSIVAATQLAEVWSVPTLVERQNSALSSQTAQALVGRPEMRYLPPSTTEIWSQGNERVTRRMSPEDFERLTEGERARKRLVKLLQEGGARLLVGTDTPNQFVIPGFSVHQELQNFADAGLTPYQALKAATRDAAEFMGALSVTGTISAGKRADLILLEGNPLESITNTKRRVGVMARGRWYTAGDLQKQLDALAASYAGK
ncbi:MAG TPA: amidohydrolase family protein [Pyrinomonadaceae bacterium]|nr:amidohydrolase family protein [Pyrinomonadaceae bacterium]